MEGDCRVPPPRQRLTMPPTPPILFLTENRFLANIRYYLLTPDISEGMCEVYFFFCNQSINPILRWVSEKMQHPRETHWTSSVSRPESRPFPLLGGYRGYGCYPLTGLFMGSNFFNTAGHLWEGSIGVLQLAGGVLSLTTLACLDQTS